MSAPTTDNSWFWRNAGHVTAADDQSGATTWSADLLVDPTDDYETEWDDE